MALGIGIEAYSFSMLLWYGRLKHYASVILYCRLRHEIAGHYGSIDTSAYSCRLFLPTKMLSIAEWKMKISLLTTMIAFIYAAADENIGFHTHVVYFKRI
ncbi:MAG: hypothetical protein LBV45_06525 [Xanthomonadaceae bacterium]|jgi:hypothetical protein|nr:hypothetical protein [Xanthomonadaceae bacterium]